MKHSREIALVWKTAQVGDLRDRLVGFGEHPGGDGDASEPDEVQGGDAGGDLELAGEVERAQGGFPGEKLDRDTVMQVILDVLHDGMYLLQWASHSFLATCDQRYVKSWTEWLILSKREACYERPGSAEILRSA